MTEILIITTGLILMLFIYFISPTFINKWADNVLDISKLEGGFDFIGLILAILVSFATLRFSFFLAFSLIIDFFIAKDYAVAILYSALFLVSLTLGLIFLVASIKALVKINAKPKK
jgi:hypothetical protein